MNNLEDNMPGAFTLTPERTRTCKPCKLVFSVDNYHWNIKK
jgi:hypothetical protein